MKDVFAIRARAQFFSLMGELCDSMSETFPDCAETKDWCLFTKNVVLGDEARETTALTKFYDNLQAPLVKGCAKYARAVQSLTGTLPTVFHAIAYHDIHAATASCDIFESLDLPTKLKGMSDDERGIFWQYMDELSRHTHDALRKPNPPVPTVSQISEDISRRKGAPSALTPSSASSLPAPSLSQGLADVWKKLCEARQVAFVEDEASTAALVTKVQGFESTPSCDLQACRAHKPEFQTAFLGHFSELGTEEDLTEEQWTLVDKVLSMRHMENAIPANMMRGIEQVAGKIVGDIQAGRADLSTLDIDAIGKQVLSSVSQSDVSDFASNLDKILPALERIQK